MKDLQLGRAFRLLWQTLPFLALRTTVYFGCAILVLASIIGCTWAGYAIDAEFGGLYGFGTGLILAGIFGYWLREYVLYMVTAGHIAVLVELVDGRPLPAGRGQLAYAKDRVAETFVQASVFFALDQAIKGALGTISRLFQGVLAFIPGLGGLSGFVNTLLKVSLGFVDEVILALSYRTRSANPWQTSKQGLILYAQNYKRILKSAFLLCFVYYGLLVPFFFIAWMSTGALADLLPDGAWFLAFVAALIFTWSLKKALLEPLLVTAIMQLFFKCIEAQVPNPAWEAKLNGISDAFRGLADKALSFSGANGELEQSAAVTDDPAKQPHAPQPYAPQPQTVSSAPARCPQQQAPALPPVPQNHRPRPPLGATTVFAAPPPAPATRAGRDR